MGVAIYVPGVDWSGSGLGAVTPTASVPTEALVIVGASTIIDSGTFSVKSYPVFSDNRVVWSIQSGSAYATISSAGVVQAKPAAGGGQDVVIMATYVSDPTIVATKSIRVAATVVYNFQTFGSPTISGTIYTPDVVNKGFIATDEIFNPGADGWIIQTKLKLNSATNTGQGMFCTVNGQGGRAQKIVTQTTNRSDKREVSLYASSNGTTWDLIQDAARCVLPLDEWVVLQLVCEYSGSAYNIKMGFPELGSWSSVVSVATPPMYQDYIGIGGGWDNCADAEFDLAETKIWVNGVLWWSAL